MPTRVAERGLSWAVKEVADRASAIVKLELELAASELRRKLAKFAVGIALAVGGAVLLLFALGFGLAAAGVGLATAIPAWAALLVVAGALTLLAGTLVVIAVGALRSSAPVPTQAIEEAKLTTEALRRNGN
jgi:hypothetical protein